MPTQPYTAFISYSHSDGEAFAEELKKRIANDEKGREVSIWQDLTNIHMGTWNRQIETAIEQCEFLVMVITPGALQSPNCKDEWIYARKKGVTILPVNGLPAEKEFYKQYPKWLHPQHIYNLDKQWQRFINDLTTRPIRQPVPFMARRLAEIPNYVVRADVIAEAKKLLLDEKENKVSLTTSLQGSGGFGKTTLAVALCNDDDVINTFSDGILWVTLGQQPDLLNAFRKLYEGLTGEQKAFIDTENARQQLQSAFEKRNCLLVIDDAWRRQDVKPIIDAATGITVLITTRITNLLHVEKYKAIKVDEMQSDEGTKLLTALFRDGISDPGQFKDFSKKLGEWPLLLKLAGAQIQERVLAGETPEQALAYVQKKLDRKGLHALDTESSEMREESVKICMNSSIDLLEPSAREALMQLGIFPEDAFVPFSVVAQLWNLDEFDTEELLKNLERQALLDIQLTNKTISIHDVLLHYYSENLDKSGSYERLQAKLVKSFGDFHLFNNNYAFRNYVWHLLQAGDAKTAKEILLDFDWIDLKLQRTDINSVLADYKLLNPTIDLLFKALKCSAYILADDKNQLPVQIIGRLGNLQEEAFQRIVGKAHNWNKGPWLRPLISSMNPPTVLENVVKGISNPDVPFLIHEGKIIFADWQTGLHIVSLDTGSPVYSFTTHEDTVSALIIHNRNLLVSGDGFGVIKIHDLNNYECLYSQRVSQDYVSRLSNHNDLIIGGSGDGNLIIIDAKRDFETSVYQRHTKSITSIAFLDGYLITTSPYDESLRVSPLSNPAETLVVLSTKCETALVNEDKIYYLAEKSIEVATIRNGEWKNISSIEVAGSYQALIHHGLLITSAGNDVVVIDLQTEEIAYLQGHTNTVTAIFAHGDILVSGSFDVKLKVWSLHDFLETKNYLGHSYLINQIEAFGDNILSLEKNGQLFFWRYSQPKAGEDEIDLLYYAEGYSHQNNRLVYARKDRVMFLDLDTLRRDVFVAESFWTSFEIDDEYLFITDGDGYLTKIDIASQQVLWRKLFGDNVIIGSVGNRLITKGSSQPDSLMFWDKDSCENVTTINSKIQPEIFVNLPNNMLLLAQPYANEIEIQNIESREEIAKLPISDSYLRGIAVHDENILAILDTGVLSYDLHTFQETQVETLSWEKGSIGKFNIEEKYLALGFKDGSIGLFDKYAAFARVQTFSGHTSGIEAIKILKNTVISADYNRQVHVWRIADGQIVCSLTFDEIINHLDFNEKHKVVILYGYSGRLYLMRPTGFEP